MLFSTRRPLDACQPARSTTRRQQLPLHAPQKTVHRIRVHPRQENRHVLARGGVHRAVDVEALVARLHDRVLRAPFFVHRLPTDGLRPKRPSSKKKTSAPGRVPVSTAVFFELLLRRRPTPAAPSVRGKSPDLKRCPQHKPQKTCL